MSSGSEEIKTKSVPNNIYIYTYLKQIKKTNVVFFNSVLDDSRQIKIETEFVSILASETGFKIFFLLLDRGATTTKELKKELINASRRNIRRILNKLKDLGIVEIPTLINDRFIQKDNKGPKPYVWALECASKEQVRAAWTRYREFFRKEKPSPEKIQTPLDPEYKELLPKAAELIAERSLYPDKPTYDECKKALLELGVDADDAEQLVSPLIKRIVRGGEA